MTPQAQLLAALADGPGTSYELALATGLPLKRACGTLYALLESKAIIRSDKRVRLRPRSPGAYVYTLPPPSARHRGSLEQ